MKHYTMLVHEIKRYIAQRKDVGGTCTIAPLENILKAQHRDQELLDKVLQLAYLHDNDWKNYELVIDAALSYIAYKDLEDRASCEIVKGFAEAIIETKVKKIDYSIGGFDLDLDFQDIPLEKIKEKAKEKTLEYIAKYKE